MKRFTTTMLMAFMAILMVMAKNEKDKECTLNVASYNLRMDTSGDGENAWPHRKELVKGLIRYHDLDIIGTQEGFKHQLDDILELQGYAYVGAGRDDGKEAGEHSAIFYKEDRVKLLDNGNFWFSETPEMPGKGWDANCCNRICSWAKFKDKQSNKVFFVFNSHYDHEGQIARKNSSLLLLKMIGQIAADSPVFATGDFNAIPQDEPIQIISQSGKLKDSYLISRTAPYGTEGTFSGFNLKAEVKNRIDYIWVTPGIVVEKYGVLNDMPYFRFPSDHFPVVIQAKLP